MEPKYATRSALYRGFSSRQNILQRGKTFSTSNADTIKHDIINHIYTTPGERPMLPNFGTRIPMLAFEPMDNKTIKIIEEDLRMVAKYDPRVELIDLAVLPIPDNNAIVALMDVRFVELGTSETIKLEFKVGS